MPEPTSNDSGSIGEILAFKPPYPLEALTGGYAFIKERAVPIDWERIMEALGQEWVDRFRDRDAITPYLRSRIGTAEFTRAAIEAAGQLKVATGATLREFGRQKPGTTRFYQPKDPAKPATVADRIEPTSGLEAVPEGSLLIAVPAGDGTLRWYLPLAGEDDDLRPIMDSPDWDAIWASVKALELVDWEQTSTDLSARASKLFPFTEIVRAEAAVITTRFNALDAELKFAQSQERIANALLEKFEKAGSADADEVARIGEQFRRLQTGGRRVRNQIAELKAAASALGLYLATQDNESFSGRDAAGAVKNWQLVKGQLYLVRPRTVTWTTRHKKKGSGDFFGRRKTRWRTESHTDTYQHFEAADVDPTPWAAVFAQYAKLGMDVYPFDFGEDGRLVCQGQTLADLADSLERDEPRRRRTLIALPLRERSILGDEFIAGYHLIGRPEPQLRRLDLPSLRVRHRMAYRFAWTGTTLGELVTTIPLSPGEEREVEIRSSTTYEEKILHTSSSLIELSRLDKNDFESVFEREVTKETERTTTASVSASGSYGGASGSGSFSTTNRVKDVARTLNRAVQKASHETSRKEQYSVRTERSESSVATASNALTYKVRNINEAVTLNVCFYRLYNTYDSGIAPLEADILLDAGRSLLPDADIHDRVTYGLADPSAVFDHILRPGNFPIDLSDLRDRIYARPIVVSLIAEAIVKDLPNSLGVSPLDAMMKRRPASEAAGLAPPNLPADASSSAEAAKGLVGRAMALGQNGTTVKAREIVDQSEALLKALEEALLEMPREMPFYERTSFSIDSGGLYADLVVGARTGTDAYSEARRELEKDKVKADIEVKLARAAWLRARAENCAEPVKPAGTGGR